MNGNINTSNKLGYTLVEIILVLALMGIIFSIAIPSVKLISTYNEKVELMEFKKDVMVARNKAVMENAIYTVRINIEENKYAILNSSKGFTIKEKEFVHGIVLKLDNLDHSIIFYPTGSLKKAGTIKLTNKKNEDITMTIIPATGKVSLKIR